MVPSRKVSAGALAGAVSILLVWAIGTFGHIALPAEVSSAITTLMSFITSYFVRDAEN